MAFGKATVSFQVNDNGTLYYLDHLVNSATWSGDLANSIRKLEVSFNNSNDGRKELVPVKLGREVVFSNNGKEIFKGNIFSYNVDAQGKASITCYDPNVYLTKNTDTQKFVEMTATQIVKEICTKFDVPYGYIAETDYVLPKLIFREKSLWEMMITAVTETSKVTGKKYYLGNKNGKVELYLRSEQVTQFVIENGVNLISANYSKNIEETKTQVKIVGAVEGEGEEVEVVKKDEALISEFGIMQYNEYNTETTDKDELEELATQLLKDLSKIDDEADLEAFGIDTVIAGSSVYALDALTGIKGSFYVLSDTHTFSNGNHKMSVKISATDELPELDYQDPEATEDEFDSDGEGDSDNDVMVLIKKKANALDLPTWIASAIIQVESNFNPNAAGDPLGPGGANVSFGLLQLNTQGGDGIGYTAKELFDPETNLKIGLPPIAKAYKNGKAKGLKEWELLQYVATHSGHPSYTGIWSPGYKDALYKAYKDGDELKNVSTTKKKKKESSSGGGSVSVVAGAYLTGLPALAVNGVKRTGKSDKAYQLAKKHNVRLTSAYRSPAHNASVGGSKTSDHTRGQAYDFAGTMADMDRFCASILKEGNYKQVIWRNKDQKTGAYIGGHLDHVHVAWHT